MKSMKMIIALVISVLALSSKAAQGTTTAPTFHPAEILLFVSQGTWLGGGTQAAFDAACWDEANSSTPGQEFIAAVANIQSTGAVYPRVSHLKGQVVNSDGTKLADNIDALWPQGTIDVNTYELGGPILDINGNPPATNTHVWTGSASLTTAASGADCSGWSSNTGGFGVSGNSLVTDANWWLEFFDFCTGGDGNPEENRVYCIQFYQGSAILFDPIFFGFDGSQFEFQGLSNHIFNLITIYKLNVNALFVDYVNGEEHGSVIGAVGITIGTDEIFVSANHTVLLNEEIVKSSVQTEDFSMLVNHRLVSITTGAFNFELKFVNEQRIDIESMLETSKLVTLPHGILGQTAKNIGNEPKIGHGIHGEGVVEGNMNDYLVQDGIFGTSFRVSRFNFLPRDGDNKRDLVDGTFIAKIE